MAEMQMHPMHNMSRVLGDAGLLVASSQPDPLLPIHQRSEPNCMSSVAPQGGRKEPEVKWPQAPDHFTEFRSKKSPEVHRVGKHYVGLLQQLPPPSLVQDEWDEHILPDLEKRLCKATKMLSMSLRDDQVTIECVLCMAGTKSSSKLVPVNSVARNLKDYIAIKPTVWIYCGGRRCRNRVLDTLPRVKLELLDRFLDKFSMDQPYVSLYAPWPAGEERLSQKPQLVEESNGVSFAILECTSGLETTCGTRARFTVQTPDTAYECFSTIGGLVTVDLPSGMPSEVESASETSSESDDSASTRTTSFPPERIPSAGRPTKKVTGDGKPKGKWKNSQRPSIVAYMGRGTRDGNYSLPLSVPDTSDFALIDPRSIMQLSNKYQIPGERIPKAVSDFVRTKHLTKGKVWIIASSSEAPLEGHMLAGDASIIVRGTVMRTKKIQMQSTFTGVPGLSGSWAVRDGKLCGIVYAAYSSSPYMHIIPAERVFQDIARVFGPSIPRVASVQDIARYKRSIASEKIPDEGENEKEGTPSYPSIRKESDGQRVKESLGSYQDQAQTKGFEQRQRQLIPEEERSVTTSIVATHEDNDNFWEATAKLTEVDRKPRQVSPSSSNPSHASSCVTAAFDQQEHSSHGQPAAPHDQLRSENSKWMWDYARRMYYYFDPGNSCYIFSDGAMIPKSDDRQTKETPDAVRDAPHPPGVNPDIDFEIVSAIANLKIAEFGGEAAQSWFNGHGRQQTEQPYPKWPRYQQPLQNQPPDLIHPQPQTSNLLPNQSAWDLGVDTPTAGSDHSPLNLGSGWELAGQKNEVSHNVVLDPGEDDLPSGLRNKGTRPRMKILGTSGDHETLDPRFRVRYPGNEFFRIGVVFMMLWPELVGSGVDNMTAVTIADSRFPGERVFCKIRWFIVVREGHNCCTCLSIQTYQGRGVTGTKVKSHHAIMYTGATPPLPLPGEYPSHPDEAPMGEPIRVIADDESGRGDIKMDPRSRVNLAKVYTVEHNVKVQKFGYVDPSDEWKLISQFMRNWGRSASDHLPPTDKEILLPGPGSNIPSSK
ncbi:hypothetical protein K458DRAFT_457051 [Lentithecium fluviatile CBS 122367]|uniref:DUF6590 domain-containing protein n=1 Tax=Lentithecium fluviatile CBS 122367 TaxID=1168545 RepID=A0A6G1ITN9_9PLEO|nr:hypothetical protein K458DRAFT_457051 [Lentithecium fluviatile CBS 122367]